MAAQVRFGPLLRWWVVLLLIPIGVIPSQLWASDTGLAWLVAQQQAEGQIVANADETTSQQTTFEVLRALHALNQGGGEPAVRAGQYLVTDDTLGFPYLPRRLLSRQLAGQPVSELLDEVHSHQNPDGGFAAWPGEQSTVLDTVEALEALTTVGMRDRSVIQPALQYLIARQDSDGSFSHNATSSSSIALTARVAGLLQQHLFDYNLSEPQQAAISFLWQQQSAHSWGEIWESAHALLSLIPITPDASRYAAALTTLRAHQEADGSWAGSVYATALVLRALHLAEGRELPTEPSTGSFSGKLNDGATGLPLAGVRIVLPDTEVEAMSLTDGGFEVSGLESGEYDIEYLYAGYEVVRQQVQIVAGKRLDLGTVTMQPLADVGLLQGRITDGTTGSPIQGVLVEVIGAGITTVSTAVDGGYQMTLPPGTITLSVTATGYQPVSATGTITAGATLQFSPTLLPEGTEPEPVLTLKGTILDGSADTPIAGARITYNTGTDTSTGFDGIFQLDGLTPGSLSLGVQADGYQGIQLSILVAQGGVLDLGALRLARVEPLSTSSLRGVVRDAESGMPIAGVAVTVGNQTMQGDTEGRYLLEGIQTLNFSLNASAPGYFSRQYDVELAEHGVAQMDIALQPTSFDGLSIFSIDPDRDSYPAYSQVGLNVALENTADKEQAVRLYVRVFNANNSFIEEFAVVPDATGGSDSLIVAPGALEVTAVTWFNRHYAPGTYSLWIQALDAVNGNVVAERAVPVKVKETRQLDYLRLAPDMTQTNQGASETVQILLSLRNRSNVPFDSTIAYRWIGPDGTVIHDDVISASLDPETMFSTLNLARFEQFLFSSAGRYPFEITGITGLEATVMEAGSVMVAPDVRIEVEQEVEPGTVLPQGNPNLRMKIRIKGVQAP